MSIRVTYVIPTRNRPDTLMWCLQSCLAQEGNESEILVYDDASYEPIENCLPSRVLASVRVKRFGNNLGQPAVRNVAYGAASNEIIVSLDDDMVLFDPLAVNRCVQYLSKSNDIAAVALRYYEKTQMENDNHERLSATSNRDYLDSDCASFAGGAVVLRKSAVLDCGLYPEWTYRQGEERFLSIRLLDAGYRIVMHGPPSAIHLYSPIRDRRAMNWYGIRNALLFDWICVPHPYLVPYLMKDIVKLFFYKLSVRNFPGKFGAIGWGLASIIGKWSLRKPVSRATFRKYLSLPRHGAIPLPPDWSPEPLIKMGVIAQASELDPFLKPEKMSVRSCSSR